MSIVEGMERPRRLRSPLLRPLVAEVELSPKHLILPLFVKEGGEKEEVSSMPGVFRHPLSGLPRVAEEALGVNTREELARVEGVLLRRLRAEWMGKGVRMILPETIYLEPSVELAPDVTLWPGAVLKGKTRIGEGCEVGPYAVLEDTVLEPGAKVLAHTVAQGAHLHPGASAGPFARLRPGAVLMEEVHVGNFVEVKNSLLHKGVKAGHLAYLGDAEVGEGTNIGAGVITANYDGKRKHKTEIGKKAFIGSNSVLVAPVRVGDRALVGAGSVITQDVPEGALAVARERQKNLEGYALRKLGEG